MEIQDAKISKWKFRDAKWIVNIKPGRENQSKWKFRDAKWIRGKIWRTGWDADMTFHFACPYRDGETPYDLVLTAVRWVVICNTQG